MDLVFWVLPKKIICKDFCVIEPQLTYQFTSYISLVLEDQFNGYKDANLTVHGLALALVIEINC